MVRKGSAAIQPIASALIPRPVHRLALRCAHMLRKRWWALRRPLLRGVRVLAVNGAGEVLLVQHSYGSPRWTLPGGGMARGETAIQAAARELAEETGCTLTGLVEVALTRRDWHGADNVVHVIAGRSDDVPGADQREIVAARFHAPDALPHDISAAVARDLPEWLARFIAASKSF